MALPILSIWSGRTLPLEGLRVQDLNVTGEVGERCSFRDAFKYQHRE